MLQNGPLMNRFGWVGDHECHTFTFRADMVAATDALAMLLPITALASGFHLLILQVRRP